MCPLTHSKNMSIKMAALICSLMGLLTYSKNAVIKNSRINISKNVFVKMATLICSLMCPLTYSKNAAIKMAALTFSKNVSIKNGRINIFQKRVRKNGRINMFLNVPVNIFQKCGHKNGRTNIFQKCVHKIATLICSLMCTLRNILMAAFLKFLALNNMFILKKFINGCLFFDQKKEYTIHWPYN